jgi:hypothetical protein
MLAEASPGPGERIVVAPIAVTAVRHERATRRGHHMLAHLRTEAYPVYSQHRYPPAATRELSFERNLALIDEAKASAAAAADAVADRAQTLVAATKAKGDLP